MTLTTQRARAGGRRSARQRVNELLDPDSFVERMAGRCDGVVSGHGIVNGRPVAVFATEPSRMGGALGAAGCARIVDVIELSAERGWPVVGIYHSGGARLQEGVGSLDGIGRVFAAIVAASGRVPQLSVVLGPCAGGAAYGPALTDVVVMAPEGRLFVTGPDVVRSVTGEDVDMARLGGPEPHARRSGVAHVRASSEGDALATTRELVLLLADQRSVQLADAGPIDLREVLPESPRRAYDVHHVVDALLDEGTTVELHAEWAPNVVTALGRLAGRTVGVLANNPMRLGGCLDATAGDKAARFVRLCDAHGVPLVVLVDVPGYLPGADQEWDGVLRRGAKLLHAFAGCSVPRVTIVTRKAFGGAYIAMCSRSLGASTVYAWPGAEIDVMGAEAAVGVLHKRRLAAVADEEQRIELAASLAAEHRARAGGTTRALELGLVDGVIDPSATRQVLAQELAAAPARRGATPLIPL